MLVYQSAYFTERDRKIYLLQQFRSGPEAHSASYLAVTRGSVTGDEAAAV